MSARVVLILSLGLNLLLAAWLVAKRGRVTPPPAAEPAREEPVAKSVPVWRVQRTNVIEVATNRVDAPGFHWSRIETNDYDAFVANLRAVGCPEQTIRHIVLADVEELFARRLADAEEPEFFWATESQRVAWARRKMERRGALEAMRRATEQAMRGAVGATALKDFFRADAGWARGAFTEREARRP